MIIRVEDPAIDLINELSAELGAMYGDDGDGGFVPEDVAVPRAAFVVAYLEDKQVGCGAIRPLSEKIAEVKRMYVRPSARGKGISRLILQKLESLAREYGYECIQLETGTLQKAAVQLYESMGYQRIPCFYEEYVDNPYSLCFEKAL